MSAHDFSFAEMETTRPRTISLPLRARCATTALARGDDARFGEDENTLVVDFADGTDGRTSATRPTGRRRRRRCGSRTEELLSSHLQSNRGWWSGSARETDPRLRLTPRLAPGTNRSLLLRLDPFSEPIEDSLPLSHPSSEAFEGFLNPRNGCRNGSKHSRNPGKGSRNQVEEFQDPCSADGSRRAPWLDPVRSRWSSASGQCHATPGTSFR